MMDRRHDDAPGESARYGASGPGMLAMPAPAPDVAGPTLRTARERMGMTIEDVASETRISSRHLTALEEGRFDGFAAPVYALGFARNYARVVAVPTEWIGACLYDAVMAEFDARGRFDLGWTREGLQLSTRYR